MVQWSNSPPASVGDAADTGSVPGSGRSPGEGNGNWLQYSCLKNSMHSGAWWKIVHWFTKRQTWLSNSTHDTVISFISKFSFKTQNGYILIHNQNTKNHSKFMVKYGISFSLHDSHSEFSTSMTFIFCYPRNTAVHLGCICALGHFKWNFKKSPFSFFGSFQIALGYCTKSRTSPTTDMVTETQSY